MAQRSLTTMKCAIVGCCHGELDKIYSSVRLLEQREKSRVDLVLICGDFQAIRNAADMHCMAVPPKYRQMGTFWKYYAGQVKAPYPTVFIGGNHEASNYLWELYHGGWAAENIYYLGHAGVINYRGVRIGGLSGIFKANDYKKGHHEVSPYSPSDIRSAYHVREYDVRKLLQIQAPIDIFLSHDWPRGIERYGDLKSLLNAKKFFRKEVMENDLGSPANELLLTKLKPTRWFAAHLHVGYAALVDHEKWEKKTYSKEVRDILNRRNGPPNKYATTASNPDEIPIDGIEANPDEIVIALSGDEEEEEKASKAPVEPKVTHFLGLDKCLPRRHFLQVVDVPTPEPGQGFQYDLEWLAITRAMNPYQSLTRQAATLPSEEELQRSIEQETMYLQMQRDEDELDLTIPSNFEPSAPVHDPRRQLSREDFMSLQRPILNQQTTAFCKHIGIDNKINPQGQVFPKTGAPDNSDGHSPNKKVKSS